MLTNFYFDQEMFSDKSFDLPVVNSVVLDTWLQYGCLALCRNNKSEILKAINQVPYKYKQRWVAAMSSSSYKKIDIEIDDPLLSSLAGMNEFEKIYYQKDIVTGVLVSDYQELFEDKRLTVKDVELEILTPVNINESINFNASMRMSEKDILPTENFLKVWDSRFDGLAKHSSVITILDRYMALNIGEDIKDEIETSLEGLINVLSKYKRKYVIDIYSACDIPNKTVNATRIKEYLNDVIKNSECYSDEHFEIRFSLCKNKLFRTEAHDRMICFDNHVVQIGKGVDIFRGRPIEKNIFNIKSRKATFFDDTYTQLSKNREWTY